MAILFSVSIRCHVAVLASGYCLPACPTSLELLQPKLVAAAITPVSVAVHDVRPGGRDGKPWIPSSGVIYPRSTLDGARVFPNPMMEYGASGTGPGASFRTTGVVLRGGSPDVGLNWRRVGPADAVGVPLGEVRGTSTKVTLVVVPLTGRKRTQGIC